MIISKNEVIFETKPNVYIKVFYLKTKEELTCFEGDTELDREDRIDLADDPDGYPFVYELTVGTSNNPYSGPRTCEGLINAQVLYFDDKKFFDPQKAQEHISELEYEDEMWADAFRLAMMLYKNRKDKDLKKTPIIVIPRLYITKQAYLEINKNIFSGIISAFSNKFFKSFEIAINSTPVADFEYEPYLSADGGKVLEQNIKWLSEKGFEFFKNDTVTQYATARYFIYNPK